MSKPTSGHMVAAKRILRYLRGLPNLRITYIVEVETKNCWDIVIRLMLQEIQNSHCWSERFNNRFICVGVDFSIFALLIGDGVHTPLSRLVLYPRSACVCVCVCVFIKLHMTAQSGLVILVCVCVCVCYWSV